MDYFEFINRVPGPILAYAGILLLNFCTDIQVFDTMSLVICGLAVVLCKVADMFVPKVAGLISEYGKSGKWGCVIGSMLGVLGVWPTISSADDNTTVILTMVLDYGSGLSGFSFCLCLHRRIRFT